MRGVGSASGKVSAAPCPLLPIPGDVFRWSRPRLLLRPSGLSTGGPVGTAAERNWPQKNLVQVLAGCKNNSRETLWGDACGGDAAAKGVGIQGQDVSVCLSPTCGELDLGWGRISPSSFSLSLAVHLCVPHLPRQRLRCPEEGLHTPAGTVRPVTDTVSIVTSSLWAVSRGAKALCHLHKGFGLLPKPSLVPAASSQHPCSAARDRKRGKSPLRMAALHDTAASSSSPMQGTVMLSPFRSSK